MKILTGHNSPETAFVVDDYPYGFTLRCKIRYWLESNPKKGVRFCSQTTNPKRGNAWNKPKASTYCRFAGCMFLDEKNHVAWSGISEYSGLQECLDWQKTFGAGVPEIMQPILAQWIKLKTAYNEQKAQGKIAFVTTTTNPDGTKTVERQVLEPETIVS